MSLDDDGVYRSRNRRIQRWKKAAVGIAGLAVLGSGAYFAADMYTARRDLTIAEPPTVVQATTKATSAAPRMTATLSPTPFDVHATKSGVKQLTTPSPTPAPTLLPDDALAGSQVSRLLQAPEPSGMALADSPVTVARRTGIDGSQVRVVSARRDLTEVRYGLLYAADLGQPVGQARCTKNLRPDPRQPVQNRPAMLLCWRASDAKSVVTIAVAAPGKQPLAGASVDLLSAEWDSLG